MRGPEDEDYRAGLEARGLRQELALQLDLEGLVEPLAGFVEVGEHHDGPFASSLRAASSRTVSPRLPSTDDCQGTALRRLGRIPGEHLKLLETFHVGVAVGRRNVDDLAVMQGALLDGFADGVQETPRQ